MFKIFRQVIIILFTLLLCNSCKKETIDYREKYIGEWTFITDVYDMTYPVDPPFESDTTYNYRGKIWNDSSNKIFIEYGKHNIISANVTLEGEIKSDSLYNNSYDLGSFINNDSLFLKLTTFDYPKIFRHIVHGKKND